MNEALKNPLIVFIAGLLVIWLAFKVLKVVIGMFWLIVLAFIILFVVNERFRNIVRGFLAGIFNR